MSIPRFTADAALSIRDERYYSRVYPKPSIDAARPAQFHSASDAIRWDQGYPRVTPQKCFCGLWELRTQIVNDGETGRMTWELTTWVCRYRICNWV